ncbi:MAG TPA: AsnC family transcriptional regulator [Candidatus Sumerlaeota bacterium]|nr:AsnC family transcriptional regulator [Candidatus Sumerlaeota bacterium]HPS03003.1 AsnC family transcriptional regulator [Candidatus Sumerlaeota bacterium]
MLSLDDLDRRILDAVQTAFPLDERPFRVLAERLQLSEEALLTRLRALKESGLIRQLSAIFDSAALGYQSTLLAFELPPEALESAAARINSHPGVSHNYEREHRFNLWSTLTVPPEADLRAHARALARLAGARTWLFLPAFRVFKIGVWFSMGEPEGEFLEAERPGSETDSGLSNPVHEAVVPLSDLEQAAVRALQTDLPLEAEPFSTLAATQGLTSVQLLNLARQFLERGAMRRFAAILRHRQAGYTANIMSAWNVPPEQAETAGRNMAAVPQVSHCYQRPTYPPDWPYSHYAMIHGRDEAETLQAVEAIRAATGLEDYALLHSRREFKKVRVQYCAPDIEDWTREHVAELHA